MSSNEWYVARTTPWPDGQRCVEIASTVDDLDPSLLWEDSGNTYSSLAGPHNDMREAVKAAITMRDEWQRESGEDVLIGWASPLYPVSASPRSDEELRKAAEEWYAALPCCSYCGDKVTGPDPFYRDDWGDPFAACNDWHAHLVQCDRAERAVVQLWYYWREQATLAGGVQAKAHCMAKAASIASEYEENYGTNMVEEWG